MNFSVFVQGQFANSATRRIFKDRGFEIKEVPAHADIIVWTGGEDIDPLMYDEKPIPETYYNRKRDVEDVSIYREAEKDGKILIGICRGAQLLNVLNGGKMWQDVNGHGSTIHQVFDNITKEFYSVNSIHHQMMIPPKHAEIVGWNAISTQKESYSRSWIKKPGAGETEIDPEVVWFPRTKALCFQGHPEFGHQPTNDYFFQLVDRYIKAA